MRFDKPIDLGQFIRRERTALFNRPKDRKQVCVGWDGNVVRVCDDNGAIDYTFHRDGRISRQSHAGYCRQIESVDRHVMRSIELHNLEVRESEVA
jgi:hypothetical protein